MSMNDAIDIAIRQMAMNETAADNARLLQSIGITDKFVEWMELHNAKVTRIERERIMDIISEAKAVHQFVDGEEYTEYDSGWSDALSVVSKVVNK